jgi:hypothetical protein
MSTKDWKNGELKSLLTEAWGFKMDLNKLNEDLADQHRTAGNTLDEEEGLEEIDSEEEYEKGAAAHTGAREATLDTLKSLPGGKQTVVGMPTKTTDVTSRGAISAAGTAGQTAREKATKGGIAGLATTPGGVAKRTTKKAVRAAGGSKSQARQAGKKAKQITKGVQKSGGEYDRGDYFEEQAPAGLKSKAGRIGTKASPAVGHWPTAHTRDARDIEAISTVMSPEEKLNLAITVDDVAQQDYHPDRKKGQKVDHAGLRSKRSNESLEEMCGPEHDGAEVVIMGDEEGVVGDEAADPAERVAALMDELKDLLMQLAGGGEEIETVIAEKGQIVAKSPKHRAAIKKVDPEMPIVGGGRYSGIQFQGQEDAEFNRKKSQEEEDTARNESREEQLRKMVRKAIREAMK